MPELSRPRLCRAGSETLNGRLTDLANAVCKACGGRLKWHRITDEEGTLARYLHGGREGSDLARRGRRSEDHRSDDTGHRQGTPTSVTASAAPVLCPVCVSPAALEAEGRGARRVALRRAISSPRSSPPQLRSRPSCAPMLRSAGGLTCPRACHSAPGVLGGTPRRNGRLEGDRWGAQPEEALTQ
jgi:hypothetical protein